MVPVRTLGWLHVSNLYHPGRVVLRPQDVLGGP